MLLVHLVVDKRTPILDASGLHAISFRAMVRYSTITIIHNN